MDKRAHQLQRLNNQGFHTRNTKLVSAQAASIYWATIPNCNVSIVYDAGNAIAAERPGSLHNSVALIHHQNSK